MDPLQRYNRVMYEWMYIMLESTGYTAVLTGEPLTLNLRHPAKLNGRLLIIYILIVLGCITIIYTIICFDFVTKLHCVFFSLVFIQVVVKLYNARRTDDFSFFYKFLQKLYAANLKNESPYRKKVLEISALATEYMLYFEFILYAMGGLGIFAVPFIVYFMRGDFILVLPLRLPGIDDSTFEGFCFYWVYQTINIFGSAYGLAIIDFLYAIPILNSLMISEIINDEMDQLNDYLVQSEVDPLVVKVKFRNILLMHKEMAEFMKRFEELFFLTCLAQIGCAALSCIILLFLIIGYDVYEDCPLVIASVGQMFLFCAMGSIVEIANDRIETQLLELKWYIMPKEEQHKYCFFFSHCQVALLLSIGRIRPLNMDTFVRICKSIYNFTMIAHSML